jgi:predicted outer membrane repeat protein
MQRRPLTLAVAFALVAGTVIVPGVGATGHPTCLVSNERTHLGSTSLQAGIDAARAGDTLIVKGTCVGSPPSQPSDRGASNIRKSLTIRGVSNKAFGPATLDGGGVARVLFVDFWDPERRGFSLTLENLTITNGYGEDGSGGGGLLAQGGTVVIKNSVVTGNSAGVLGGGGIEAFADSMTITHTTVSNNVSGDGGGGILAGGALTIEDSAITGNVSGFTGGGVFFFSGDLNVRNSTVSGNSALQGGGISSDWGGSVTLEASAVTGNEATSASGGGIFNGLHGTMTISSSMVSGNTAGSFAGGISNYGTLTFAAPPTTVGGNTAQYAPGGVSNQPWYSSTVTGGCPVSLGGNVNYDPTNTPTDYAGFACPMPVPVLAANGTENYTDAFGSPYTRYKLTITNWTEFAPELFTLAPDLTPCGLSASASRTWVWIHRATDSSVIYGFCGLTSPTHLTQLWFGLPLGTTPPSGVFVTLTDRRTGQIVTSNTVSFAP